MEILKRIIAAIVETALIFGSLFLFNEQSTVFCILFVFLLIFVPLMGYYLIKEKKPIWMLIVLILLLPISYLGNLGITHLQDAQYDKEMNALVEDNQAKAQEMTINLKTLLENNDIDGLKSIYTEDSIKSLTDNFDIKKIKINKFGEDLELEPYDTESWGAFGTGDFTYEGKKYYIEYSITGTKEDANYSEITIVPYELYEKSTKITDDSDTEEVNKLYEELDEAQIYLESIYDSENQDIESYIDFDE